MSDLVVGVDFGSLSARAVVVRVSDGAELGVGEHAYTHAVLTEALPTGEPLGAEWALQDPEDWLESLQIAVGDALAAAGGPADRVVGIGLDTTASTPLPARADGTALRSLDAFARHPHAWPKLWKHHAAQPQADRITQLARERDEFWLARYGGVISSEWQLAKALQVFDEDQAVWDATDVWVEMSDWIVWQLSGVLTRNVTAAGYKGMLQDGELPSAAYLDALAPGFASWRARAEGERGALGTAAGPLSDAFAERLGLPAGIPVAVGNVDAHVAAASAGTTGPGALLAIMGTSTCHVLNGTERVEVPGMCGVVDGGIVDGRWGYEAGQSGVGDIFAWYVQQQVPPATVDAARAAGQSVHEYLTELAWQQPAGAHGLLALDWQNGNRSILVDARLSGLLVGTTLATKPEEVYRALVEATAFGARVIVEAFRDAGLPVDRFVATGGLLRNRHLMQTYADVLGMPIDVTESTNGPALGSAIHAAVAAGRYPDVEHASRVMAAVREAAYVPDPQAQAVYDEMYRDYRELHDAFGRGEHPIMHRAKARRDRARA